MRRKKLISIVVPCYNEEENVQEAYRQLIAVTQKLTSYRFELIFVDNGSSDTTWEKIEQLYRKDSRVIGITLSRNFGPDASGLAGFAYARGDAVISYYCDLQDPVELIPDYIKKWEEGNDLVIGVYTRNEDRVWMSWIRRSYYRIFKAIANIDIPVNSSGIGLNSRRALDAYLALNERFRSSVGLRAWIGFKTAFIYFTRRKRQRGKSSYNLFRYLQVAERGFLGFSYMPLDIIVYVGFVTLTLSFIFLIAYLLAVGVRLMAWDQTAGIIMVVIFIGGVQLLATSAIGKYIQVLVEETKRRPHYIVSQILDRKKKTIT